MPGKINPTQCEALTMVCAHVFGNHATVTFAGCQRTLRTQRLQAGDHPGVLQSIRLLADAAASFAEHMVAKLEREPLAHRRADGEVADAGHRAEPAHRLRQCRQIAKKAHAEDKTLREAALELGLLTGEQFDRLVRPEDMLGPSDA